MMHNHLQTGRWNDDACSQERGWVCYKKKCERRGEGGASGELTSMVLLRVRVHHTRPPSPADVQSTLHS